MYLLRHGQTKWNAVGRMQGWQDSPLTVLGCQQARQLGRSLRRALADRAIEMVASPLGRTWHTAEIVAREMGYPWEKITAEESLREINWGDWNGRDKAEIANRWPELWQARENDKWNTRPPAGESYADLAAR